MSDNYNWETVDIPPMGTFIGWGDKVNQSVTGVVLEYGPTSGRDMQNNQCPSVTMELIEDAWTHTKKNGWQKIAKGELVQMTCGLTVLKRGILTADPKPGDLIKATLNEILYGQGKDNGDVKMFDIKIVRGFRRAPAPNGAPPTDPSFANGGPVANSSAPQQQFAVPGGPPGGPGNMGSDDPPF